MQALRACGRGSVGFMVRCSVLNDTVFMVKSLQCSHWLRTATELLSHWYWRARLPAAPLHVVLGGLQCWSSLEKVYWTINLSCVHCQHSMLHSVVVCCVYSLDVSSFNSCDNCARTRAGSRATISTSDIWQHILRKPDAEPYALICSNLYTLHEKLILM